ncbi:MAG TPA: hypothetical protein VFU56_09925 [Gaiellaceae bacterium]|nr:hypothetical protein [Gaiellaceae bacterium]
MRALFSAAIVAAVLSGAALAASGERVQIHFNAADQAAARRAVAHRTDLGSAAGWTGGATKPDLSAAPTCANFHPKQRDLVLTGAAASKWSYSGLQIYTQSQVLKTPAMVAADWQRTVVAPTAIPCQRSHVLKDLGAGVTFVSFRRVLFPPVATRSRAYVLLVDVKTQTGKVRVAIELVLIGTGRTELTIESTAPNVAQKVVAQADAQLARALVARAVR